MALNTLMRIVEGRLRLARRCARTKHSGCDSSPCWAALRHSVIISLHAETWHELQRALPTPTEMLHTLLTEVGAEPATYVEQPDQPDTASPDLTSPGTYRAAPGTTKHHSKWPTER